MAKKHYSKQTGEKMEKLFVELPESLMKRIRLVAKQKHLTLRSIVQHSLEKTYQQQSRIAQQKPAEDYNTFDL
jgi:hypothetical protein